MGSLLWGPAIRPEPGSDLKRRCRPRGSRFAVEHAGLSRVSSFTTNEGRVERYCGTDARPPNPEQRTSASDRARQHEPSDGGQDECLEQVAPALKPLAAKLIAAEARSNRTSPWATSARRRIAVPGEHRVTPRRFRSCSCSAALLLLRLSLGFGWCANVVEYVSECLDARQVLAGQRFELCMSSWRELKVDLPVVGRVSCSLDQSRWLRPLGELDGAVVADVQLVGGLSDRPSFLARCGRGREQS